MLEEDSNRPFEDRAAAQIEELFRGRAADARAAARRRDDCRHMNP
jgi:hypothetical protein